MACQRVRVEEAPVVAVVLVVAIDSNGPIAYELLHPRAVGEPIHLVDVEVRDEDGAHAGEEWVSDGRSPTQFIQSNMLLLCTHDE